MSKKFYIYKSYTAYYSEEPVHCECLDVTVCSGIVAMSAGPLVNIRYSSNKEVSEIAVFRYLGEHLYNSNYSSSSLLDY